MAHNEPSQKNLKLLFAILFFLFLTENLTVFDLITARYA